MLLVGGQNSNLIDRDLTKLLNLSSIGWKQI